MVAVKKGIPVIHVEAGLRSFDRGMPEEINRVLTDKISDLLFTTEVDAQANLEREGIDSSSIHFAGNVMIDTLYANRGRAIPPKEILDGLHDASLFLEAEAGFGIVTLHRPSNVDDPTILKLLLETIVEISQRVPIIFPIHPRTLSRITDAGLSPLMERGQIAALPPLGYLEMLGLMQSATLVLTDSGGIQEETTALGVPCITLRENTERPITVTQGTNTIVGVDPLKIMACFEDILSTGGKKGRIPPLWDGNAAVRIADTIADWAAGRNKPITH